jgi:mannose-6-phosphate isomerase-like protein (cupin superfamily)
MRYHLQPAAGGPETTAFSPTNGCAEFEQRVLRFDGAAERPPSVDDELLYVLRGRGVAAVEGERVPFVPGTAVYVAAGSRWSVDEAEELEILSVLVRGPLPIDGAGHAIVGLEDAEEGQATAGRMFRLLAPCRSATQFVGYIPAGRAPDHYHLYD